MDIMEKGGADIRQEQQRGFLYYNILSYHLRGINPQYSATIGLNFCNKARLSPSGSTCLYNTRGHTVDLPNHISKAINL